mmetsp:Transcript_99926/g.322184  ORF Transcript_99926/g.322184 Transcript_99926/m.322184 type:complete len:245 (-) Transcript_99926:761-1495(-)
MTPSSAADHARSSSLLFTCTPIFLPPKFRMKPPKMVSTLRTFRRVMRSAGRLPVEATRGESQMSRRSSKSTLNLMAMRPRFWNPSSPWCSGRSLRVATHCATWGSAASTASSFRGSAALSGSRLSLLQRVTALFLTPPACGTGLGELISSDDAPSGSGSSSSVPPPPPPGPSLSGSKAPQSASIQACMSCPAGILRFRFSLTRPSTKPASCTRTSRTSVTRIRPLGATPRTTQVLSAKYSKRSL